VVSQIRDAQRQGVKLLNITPEEARYLMKKFNIPYRKGAAPISGAPRKRTTFAK
jgi:hypothetical protein